MQREWGPGGVPFKDHPVFDENDGDVAGFNEREKSGKEVAGVRPGRSKKHDLYSSFVPLFNCFPVPFRQLVIRRVNKIDSSPVPLEAVKIRVNRTGIKVELLPDMSLTPLIQRVRSLCKLIPVDRDAFPVSGSGPVCSAFPIILLHFL